MDSYKDPDQNLKFAMCNLYRHVSGFSFSKAKIRLCVYSRDTNKHNLKYFSINMVKNHCIN